MSLTYLQTIELLSSQIAIEETLSSYAINLFTSY